MNGKTMIKILCDGLMAALYLLLMNLSITGVFVHEILGVGILALTVLHLAVNKAWIRNVFRRLREGKDTKRKASLALNIATGLSAAFTIASGIMISHFLFPFLAVSDIGLWMNIHDIFAWITLGLAVAHCLAHRRWIAGVILSFRVKAGRLAAATAKAGAGIFAAATIATLMNGLLSDAVADYPSGPADTPKAVSFQQAGHDGKSSAPSGADAGGSTLNDSTTAQNDATLQEYLGKLFCTACHRHCPLSSPRCDRGVEQAEEQTLIYESTYRTNDD